MDINTLIPICCTIITTIIAIAVAIFTAANFILAKRRRKDELFDRRYKLYQEIRTLWLATGGDTPRNTK